MKFATKEAVDYKLRTLHDRVTKLEQANRSVTTLNLTSVAGTSYINGSATCIEFGNTTDNQNFAFMGSGNVGIGLDDCSSATAKLDVNGTAYIRDNLLVDGTVTINGAVNVIAPIDTTNAFSVIDDTYGQQWLLVDTFNYFVRIANVDTYIMMDGPAFRFSEPRNGDRTFDVEQRATAGAAGRGLLVAAGQGGSGASTGGTLYLRGGAYGDSGTNGSIRLGDLNTAEVRIAASGINTTILGPIQVNSSTGSSSHVLTGGSTPTWTLTSSVGVTLGPSNFDTPSVEVISDAGSASPGTAITAIRSDARLVADTAIAVSIGTTNALGAATTLARSNHTHEVTGLSTSFGGSSNSTGQVAYFTGGAWGASTLSTLVNNITTLDAAYDGTGAHLGRTINVDAGFHVLLTQTDTGTATMFQITQSGSGDAAMTWAAGSNTWIAGVDNSQSGDPWKLSLGTALGTSDALSVDATGVVIGALGAAGDSLLHVWASSAGSVTASSNTVHTIERNGNAYLSFLGPATADQGIIWERPSAAARAVVLFSHSTDKILIRRGTGGYGVDVNGNAIISSDPESTTVVAGLKLNITQAAASSGTNRLIRVTGVSHTNQTTGTELVDIDFNLARTVQFATGAITNQRAVYIQAPTYGFVGSSTITTAATLAISGAPATGTNATLTNTYALLIENGLTGVQTIRAAAGSVSAPSFAFTGDTSSGLYLPSAGSMTASASGIGIQVWRSTGVSITQDLRLAGTPTLFTLTGAGHNGLTASTEMTDVLFSIGRTVTFAAGNITNQRAVRILAPTYAFSIPATSTITNAATVYIDNAPSAGANGAITNAYALWIDAGTTRMDGAISLGTATGSSSDVLTGGSTPAWTASTSLSVTLAAANFSTPSVNVLSDASSATAGTAVTAIRSDARLIATTAIAVSIGTTNAQGNSTSLARANHTHEVTSLSTSFGGSANSSGQVVQFNGSAWTAVSISSVTGTLDDAYDSGGAHNGRTINVDATFPVLLAQNDSSTSNLLHLNQSGTGDASIRYQANSTSWVMGIDNSQAGDPFKIGDGGALGTGDWLAISSTGVSIGNLGADSDSLLHVYLSNTTLTARANTVLTVERNGSSLINVLGGSAATAIGIYMDAPSVSGAYLLYNANTDKVTLSRDGGTAGAITISSTGVGVGTTSPTEALHVYRATGETTLKLESGNDDAFTQYTTPAGSWSLGPTIGAFGADNIFALNQAGDLTDINSQRFWVEEDGPMGFQNINGATTTLPTSGAMKNQGVVHFTGGGGAAIVWSYTVPESELIGVWAQVVAFADDVDGSSNQVCAVAMGGVGCVYPTGGSAQLLADGGVTAGDFTVNRNLSATSQINFAFNVVAGALVLEVAYSGAVDVKAVTTVWYQRLSQDDISS